MACCENLNGILLGCQKSIGGIRRAFIICSDEVTPTISTDVVSGFTLEEGAEFKLYEFRKQTGSVTTTITADDANGTVYFESAIVLQFSKQEASKRIEIQNLSASDVVVIIEDNNGNYWYFGYTYPVTLSDGTAETGTAFTDFNGYNITLTDVSRVMPYSLSEAAVTQLLAAVA